MNAPGPCDAFKKRDSYYTCWDCGLPYWVHSHEYIPATGHPYARGKARHILITRHQASEMYHRYGHTLCVQVWEPDLRPRYQIMAERRVSISKFVAAAIIRGRSRRLLEAGRARQASWFWADPPVTRQDEVALDA